MSKCVRFECCRPAPSMQQHKCNCADNCWNLFPAVLHNFWHFLSQGAATPRPPDHPPTSTSGAHR
eukprot:7336408-Alexandrium_andersonii.AAC.1